MMLALLTGWLLIGAGARVAAVVMGGVGFGLFLDEVGKFVTKDNDYFYGPAAEIMYILVVVILVGARVLRDFRPLTGRECLASAAVIAGDGSRADWPTAVASSDWRCWSRPNRPVRSRPRSVRCAPCWSPRRPPATGSTGCSSGCRG